MWAWNVLPLNTYISMYARTNRCYNERGSRTNYIRPSILHSVYNSLSVSENTLLPLYKDTPGHVTYTFLLRGKLNPCLNSAEEMQTFSKLNHIVRRKWDHLWFEILIVNRMWHEFLPSNSGVHSTHYNNKKKQSHYRPGVAQRVPGS
jgi:hypothetical protein